MKKIFKLFIFIIIFFIAIIFFLNRDINTSEYYPTVSVSKDNLYRTVYDITHTEKAREYDNPEILVNVSKYINNKFKEYGYKTEIQQYTIKNEIFENVIASYGDSELPRFILGAHYDQAGHFKNAGADDNASGVAGLLEIARLINLNKPKLNYRIDFVAYTLEEPPIFQSNNMGSYKHAEYLNTNDIDVIGMAVLEMIGYYSEEENSQRFPYPINKFNLYPNTGNFIAIVSNFPSNDIRLELKKSFLKTNINTETLLFPSSIKGIIDLSDHNNYWKFDFPAVMITDTAFFRNENYHTPYDTIETLNFDKMAEVVKGTYWFLINKK